MIELLISNLAVIGTQGYLEVDQAQTGLFEVF
jgi:hypothetical protein